MSLNETVSADRVHIGFFGRRNVGKSSLVNAVTGQKLAVVSDVLGTTTDPVKKAMELLPIGPVMIIDTPGFDDVGELGEMRVEKTREILAKTDVAVLVTDSSREMGEDETEFLSLVREKKLACIVAYNKCDGLDKIPASTEHEIWVSAKDGININELKEKIGALAKGKQNTRRIVADLISAGDVVVLVTPIDESAPKGRLILPQQQTIRDIIDSHAIAVVCQPEELTATLAKLVNPPKMVITDSQAFGKVAPLVPLSVPLTSFSILFARYKGELLTQVKGAAALSNLREGDRILIAEGCTHHRQCGDIGTVKLPRLIEKTVGFKPDFTFTSGGEFPKDLAEYKLLIHCGACMLNEAEVAHRIGKAISANVPAVNYGMAIAYMNGILRRSLELFPEALAVLGE
ncbi:MAG: [Clostridia bacterium]|nr:[FeFe] hydrogenase H-cluster maturation GTPase HydF [Clostridia bacterium]